MTRNSPSIPGGNLDAVTFPSIHSVTLRDCDCGDAEECDCPVNLDADWTPPSLCFCGRDRAECAPDGSMCTDEFRPVEPAHVADDFEAGYGPYDRDED